MTSHVSKFLHPCVHVCLLGCGCCCCCCCCCCFFAGKQVLSALDELTILAIEAVGAVAYFLLATAIIVHARASFTLAFRIMAFHGNCSNPARRDRAPVCPVCQPVHIPARHPGASVLWSCCTDTMGTVYSKITNARLNTYAQLRNSNANPEHTRTHHNTHAHSHTCLG